jgi:hypothetical protein
MRKLLFAFLFATTCLAQGVSAKPWNHRPKPPVERPEDWKSLWLTASLASAELYDGATTARRFSNCSTCSEADPVSRLFIGSRGSAPRMATFGTLEAGGLHFVAQRMRRSQNRWVNHFWWTPEVGAIGVHAWAGTNNVPLRGRAH